MQSDLNPQTLILYEERPLSIVVYFTIVFVCCYKIYLQCAVPMHFKCTLFKIIKYLTFSHFKLSCASHLHWERLAAFQHFSLSIPENKQSTVLQWHEGWTNKRNATKSTYLVCKLKAQIIMLMNVLLGCNQI